MSLFLNISQFGDKFVSIKKLDTYLSIDLKFPIDWEIKKDIIPDDIEVIPKDVPNDNRNRQQSFVCIFNEYSIGVTIDLILKIIKYNEEKEVKRSLFIQLVNKLKDTFENNDLDQLNTLYDKLSVNNSVDDNVDQDIKIPVDTEVKRVNRKR